MKVKQQIVMNGYPSAGLGAFGTFSMRWLPLFCTLHCDLVAGSFPCPAFFSNGGFGSGHHT